MKNSLNLIVMLTHNDKTSMNAYDIFEKCKNSKAKFFGFKEKPLPLSEMKKLYKYMKKCGKKTVLEVVSYTESEGIEGAKMAEECGVDILMGTKYFASIHDICEKNNIKYMPFVGEVVERPSVLKGTVDSMINEANRLVEKGVYGFDLLGYRFEGNASELNKQFVSKIDVPVCVAGSVDSYTRLDELKEIRPWAFTIGGAFFENKFGDDFYTQINNVCEYVK